MKALTARELAAMKLPELPQSERGIQLLAGRDGWEGNKRPSSRGRTAIEYDAAMLLLGGTVLGVLSAAMAVWPNLQQSSHDLPMGFVIKLVAAIVVFAVSHSLDPGVFRPCFRLHRDRIVVVAAVVAVLLLGVLDGLLAAIGVSLMMTLKRLSDPALSELGRLAGGHDFVALKLHPEAEALPGILILRPETPLFFANAGHVVTGIRRTLEGHAGLHALIVSLEESPDLDSTSVEALEELAAATRRAGVGLYFTRLKPAALTVLRRAALPGLPPDALSDLSVDDAVTLALSASLVR